MAVNITEDNIKDLQYRFEDATIKCSERCLYQSAKWYSPRFDPMLGVKLIWPPQTQGRRDARLPPAG